MKIQKMRDMVPFLISCHNILSGESEESLHGCLVQSTSLCSSHKYTQSNVWRRQRQSAMWVHLICQIKAIATIHYEI